MRVPFLSGLGLGFSLIIAIGAQNLFVLRQGVRREHVLLVAAICAVSDAVLIVLGVSGVGAATTAAPWLLTAVRWAGGAFLIAYAALAARRAVRPASVVAVGGPDAAGAAGLGSGADAGGTLVGRRAAATASSVALTALALTWLNPHVYLDTVFLVGAVAATYAERRWEFAAGAVLASVVWFTGLAYGARFLSRWLASPKSWQVLDGIIAVVMLALGVGLLLG